MHQVGDAGNRGRGERERLDQQRLRVGRRRRRRIFRIVDVVREPNRDTALGGVDERALDDQRELVGEMEVVDGDLERVLRARDERGQRLGRLLGRLASVDERPQLDQDVCPRSFALYARFAAW
jgi:hypothetical protein